MLGSLGVVFGDIGTSPLYAVREAFGGVGGLPVSEANVLGLLSLIAWTLAVIVTLKYVWLLLRFDNRGEGGVLALLAVAQRLTRKEPRIVWSISILGIFAAGLFYGDSVLTPAISVLSAVEGLNVVSHEFERYVVPIALGIIIALFLVQKHGTGAIGRWFGPIVLVWLIVLAALGVLSVVKNPAVLLAFNPVYAIDLFVAQPALTLAVMGAVFLTVTGTEAMYADLGHFGARPIRVAWLLVVWPALLANYFGQGALLLRDASAVKNPFFLLAPEALLVPLVMLATVATVIASQATIAGAFSLTQQASRLGYLPRISIKHTSDEAQGQIYITSVNWLMLVGVCLLILTFRSSSALAGAYGIAICGTEIISSAIAITVTLYLPGRRHWHWLAALLLFVCVESMFLVANGLKIPEGGWLPLLAGFVMFTVLSTWRTGTDVLRAKQRQANVDRAGFIAAATSIPRVAGTAVFLTSDRKKAPSALIHNLAYNKVLHERVVFLIIENQDVPFLSRDERVEVSSLGHGFYEVVGRYGFREQPDVQELFKEASRSGVRLNALQVLYFLSKTTIRVSTRRNLFFWRRLLFAWMFKNSSNAASYFNLPVNRVIELSSQTEL